MPITGHGWKGALPGLTIVVAHHCPHPGLIGGRRSNLDPVYGSDMLPLIERYQTDKVPIISMIQLLPPRGPCAAIP